MLFSSCLCIDVKYFTVLSYNPFELWFVLKQLTEWGIDIITNYNQTVD